MDMNTSKKGSPFITDLSTEDVPAIGPDEPSRLSRLLEHMKKNILLICLVFSLFLGIALGAGLRQLDPPLTEKEIGYLKFPGDLLMNMLKMLILPLIVSSLISGLTALDTRASGKMGAFAITYYLTTTLAAVILGIILVVSIQPGHRGGGSDDYERTGEAKVVNPADTFLDLLRQCFTDNLVEACFQKPVTKQVAVTPQEPSNITSNDTAVEKEYKSVTMKVPGMNVLGLVVFSIAFGIIIGKMGEKGKPLKDLFDSLCEAIMQLVHIVIWYSPIGVMFLVAAKVVEMKNIEKTFQQLLFYMITVMCGLVGHGFITLPAIYAVIVRKNPFKYMLGVVQAILTALGTSSSSATLPITIDCLEKNNGVDSRVTKFVAPVGATINMDGTALYEAVAVIFIGQVNDFDLTIGSVVTVSVTATAAAIGAAGVPQAGLVTMVIVLTAVGFPTDDITLIIAIDWLLDRFRTAINVLGDAYGAGIVAHLSKSVLSRMDEEDRLAAELEEGKAENTTELTEMTSKSDDDFVNGYVNGSFEEARL